MEKQVFQADQVNSDPPLFAREQEFSFVQPTNKNSTIANHLHAEIKLARQPEHSHQRSYELTFQNASLPVINLSNLKRVEKVDPENSKHARVLGQEQHEDELKQSQSERHRAEEIEKTEHSSSSEANDLQEKLIDCSISQGELKIQDIKTKRLSFLIKKQDSQNEFVELDCELPNVYESQILLNRDIQDYSQDRANICGSDYIQFSKFKISLQGMQKLKIYPQIVKKKSFRIKITHEMDVYNFGVELRRELFYLPEHYIWFAKLINARLMKKGCKMQQNLPKQNGVLHGNGIFNQGIIYKCSKYRKKWEKRFILINNEGLFSYKNQKENYSVSILSSTIEELWTNFELYGSFLIIKIKHKGDKTEFAIPVLDFCEKENPANWLFAFYRLLMEHKIHIKI